MHTELLGSEGCTRVAHASEPRSYVCTLYGPMCSTVAPMARGGAGYIPGNDTGQGITSSSAYTHVQVAYGAPTGAVGGATDGSWNAVCARSILRMGDNYAIKAI